MRSIAGWVQQAVPGRAGPSPLLRPPSLAVEVLETWREHALFTRLPFPIWFHFYWPEGSFLQLCPGDFVLWPLLASGAGSRIALGPGVPLRPGPVSAGSLLSVRGQVHSLGGP